MQTQMCESIVGLVILTGLQVENLEFLRTNKPAVSIVAIFWFDFHKMVCWIALLKIYCNILDLCLMFLSWKYMVSKIRKL